MDGIFKEFNYKGFAEKEAEQLKTRILNSPNTEKIYDIKGTKYYISQNGDDKNDGLSPETPFKSLKNFEKIKLEFGDAVLFERGSVFHSIELVGATKETASFIVAKSGVTYGAYGEGKKPELYASYMDYAVESLWKQSDKPNVWELDYDMPTVCGIVFDKGRTVGVVKYTNKPRFSDEQDRVCFSGVAEITENEQLSQDYKGKKVYLYCDKGNPAKVYDSIEIIPHICLFKINASVTDVTIDNICFKYAGFGISDIAAVNTNITNCEIGFMGGLPNEGVRFGNAYEIWARAKNVKVENNWVYQSFDSALSWQGNSGEDYINVSFSNNLLEYNNCDIEFFDRNTSRFENIKMDNNIMRFTCLGWGTRLKDEGIRGIEGCLRAISHTIAEVKNISFKGNIMDCPARQVIDWHTTEEQLRETSVSDNILFINNEYRKIFGRGTEVIARLPLSDTDGMRIDNEKYVKVFADDQNSLENIWKLWNKDGSDRLYWNESL